jgi:hypothetical protein
MERLALESDVALETSPGAADFLLFLHPAARWNRRGLFRLVNHLRRHPEWEGVAPLAFGGTPPQDPIHRLHTEIDETVPLELLDHSLTNQLHGHFEPMLSPAATGFWLARRGSKTEDALRRALRGDRRALYQVLPLNAVAHDVAVSLPRPDLINSEAKPPSLSAAQKQAAETRIRDLADWLHGLLGREKPVPWAFKDWSTDTTAAEAPDSEERASASVVAPSTPANGNGRETPIRLIRHYLQKGDTARAGRVLKRAMAEHPDDNELQALDAEFRKGATS